MGKMESVKFVAMDLFCLFQRLLVD